MTATPFASAAGSTSSRGFRRKGFRMIWIEARCSRSRLISASSQVSTLTPQAAIFSSRAASASSTSNTRSSR